MRTLAARGLLPPDQADQPEEPPTPEPTDTFSIVLIPDTQRLAASSSWIAHFQAAANWIATNKEARNIELVLHLGDVVNDGNTTQFDRAEMPMATIWDTGIPFGACIGNHDYDGGSPAADRSNTTMWNSYFGID